MGNHFRNNTEAPNSRSDSIAREARAYSSADVPQVYFKQTDNQRRKDKKPYNYEGNFNDVQHIMQSGRENASINVNNSNASFATLLRHYETKPMVKSVVGRVSPGARSDNIMEGTIP